MMRSRKNSQQHGKDGGGTVRRTWKSGLLLTALIFVSMTTAGIAQSQDAVTFTKDIAPILQDRCQVCHRPGTFAPMSLQTYEETRPWAKSIKQKVSAREMPPWFIDKNVGVQNF